MTRGARRAHVGYYLIDRGLRELERAARFRRPVSEVVRDTLGRGPLLAYLGAIVLITILTSAVILPATGNSIGWRLAVYVAALLLATSQLAVALVNWFATLVVVPRALPRMDFSTGIPSTSRTLVSYRPFSARLPASTTWSTRWKSASLPTGIQPSLRPADRFSGCGR